MEDILVFGAGGHAKVIIELIECQQLYRVKAVIDREADAGSSFAGYPLIAESEFLKTGVRKGIVAIGDNWVRAKVVQSIKSQDGSFSFVPLIHPQAIVSKSLVPSAGSVIMAGAVIQVDAKIGEHAIVNTRASVDHDCTLGDYSSVNPGAVLGGNVHLGDFSAIGLGATVREGVSIGNHTIVGAGSVVTGDISSGVLAYGVPARTIRKREPGPYLSHG